MGVLGPMGPGGFRRRGRRRGLVVGAAVGAAAGRASAKNSQNQPQEPTPPNDTDNQFDELEKLAKLKDQGVLTQEEFDAKKKQILDL